MKPAIFTMLTCLIASQVFSQDQASFTVSSPNSVPQLGSFDVVSEEAGLTTFDEIVVRIDLSAKKDSFRELAIRRQELKLQDGRFITSIGYDQGSDLVIGAVAPVKEISVVGIETTDSGTSAFVVFYDEDHKVIAPDPNDIAVFNGDFSHLPTSYEPLVRPQSFGLTVSLLIDGSGSMQGFMPEAIEASKSFLANLPDYSNCQIILFNSTVTHLTASDLSSLSSCPESQHFLDSEIMPAGNTALFEALGDTFTATEFSLSNVNDTVPRLVVVITDGVNTVNSSYSEPELLSLKSRNNIKTFVFWAGNYEPNHLKYIADQEVVASYQIRETLDAFFNALETSLSGIQIITTHQAGE